MGEGAKLFMTMTSAEDNEFTKKYDMYSNMIYKLSLAYLNNSSDCEDVLQDVFIKLFGTSQKFKDQEHEKSWLIRIAINSCIDKTRKNKRQQALPLKEYIFKTETNEKHMLAELVYQLPSKLKASVHLYYYEGYKVNEISKILGISCSAVKMRLKRGREMLKIQLEDERHE